VAKIPLYIPEPLAGQPLAPYFAPVRSSLTYNQLPPNFFDESVERVADPQAAQAIVLPTSFGAENAEARAYVRTYAELGEKLGLPVLAFSVGDFNDQVRFDPRVYMFRQSVYRTSQHPRDIVVPTMTEDVPEKDFSIRAKGMRPLVSFCGMAGFPTFTRRIKYLLKLWFGLAKSIFIHTARARIVGIYWRRAAMRACERSALVDTNFIIRRTFSGNIKTIELDPKVARKEYYDSIIHSDFVIAPKGDGNYSNRFLKTLAFGRMPVIVDTDMVLPLEDTIDYSRIVVRVPMDRVAETPRYVHEFYDAMTESEYAQRQRLAREVFEKYLRTDSFFHYFFTEKLKTL